MASRKNHRRSHHQQFDLATLFNPLETLEGLQTASLGDIKVTFELIKESHQVKTETAYTIGETRDYQIHQARFKVTLSRDLNQIEKTFDCRWHPENDWSNRIDTYETFGVKLGCYGQPGQTKGYKKFLGLPNIGFLDDYLSELYQEPELPEVA